MTTTAERADAAMRIEPRSEPLSAFESRLRGSIEAAIREAVNDALERAAVKVHAIAEDFGRDEDPQALAEAAEEAIRALKEPTP